MAQPRAEMLPNQPGLRQNLCLSDRRRFPVPSVGGFERQTNGVTFGARFDDTTARFLHRCLRGIWGGAHCIEGALGLEQAT